MSRIQKLILLLTFWFSPESEIKTLDWIRFTGDQAQTEAQLFQVIAYIINEIDERIVNWNELHNFATDMHTQTGLVTNQQ